MKLWITGKNGLLGSVLGKKADLATDRFEADICNLTSLRTFASQNPGITHIVNCAAFSLVDLSEVRRDEAMKTNSEGPENLAILSREIGARLVHISTDYVFSGDLRRPLKEDDPVNPCNYYGFTKLEGERRLMQVLPSACIIRTSWIFGQGGKNFVARLLQLFQEQEEIRLTDDQRGRPTYAPDLANVILQMLDESGLFQFANAGSATKYEFGLVMKEAAEFAGLPMAARRIVPISSSYFPSLCKRPAYSVFDTSKIEAKLNLSIRPWRDALQEYICAAHALYL